MLASPAPHTLPPYDRSNSCHRLWARHNFELWKLTDYLICSLAWYDAPDTPDTLRSAFLCTAELHRQALLHHDTQRPYDPSTTGCGYATDELAQYGRPLVDTPVFPTFSMAKLKATARDCSSRQDTLETLEERVLDARAAVRRLVHRGGEPLELQDAQNLLRNHTYELTTFFCGCSVTDHHASPGLQPDDETRLSATSSPSSDPEAASSNCLSATTTSFTSLSLDDSLTFPPPSSTHPCFPSTSVLTSAPKAPASLDSSAAPIEACDKNTTPSPSLGHRNPEQEPNLSHDGNTQSAAEGSGWWSRSAKVAVLKEPVQALLPMDGTEVAGLTTAEQPGPIDVANISDQAFSSSVPTPLLSHDPGNSSVDEKESLTSVSTSVSVSESPCQVAIRHHLHNGDTDDESHYLLFGAGDHDSPCSQPEQRSSSTTVRGAGPHHHASPVHSPIVSTVEDDVNVRRNAPASEVGPSHAAGTSRPQLELRWADATEGAVETLRPERLALDSASRTLDRVRTAWLRARSAARLVSAETAVARIRAAWSAVQNDILRSRPDAISTVSQRDSTDQQDALAFTSSTTQPELASFSFPGFALPPADLHLDTAQAQAPQAHWPSLSPTPVALATARSPPETMPLFTPGAFPFPSFLMALVPYTSWPLSSHPPTHSFFFNFNLPHYFFYHPPFL
ncbi:hypothetical protein CF326_g8754 [Tilletia indica]|nr:hypothetical protein CF326_g8754 [Tilletia indica]